jgi:RimJ/RimL family protein N-acetyltransferase
MVRPVTIAAEDWTIRPLGAGDAERFRALRLAALRGEPDAFGSTYESEAGDSLERFGERLADGRVLGLLRGAALIGMAGYSLCDWPKSRHKAGLWGLYVEPSERRGGAATGLMQALIRAAAGEAEILQLKVVSTNQAALRLYAKLGFRQYGLEKRALKQAGRYDDEVLMALDLTPGGRADW